MKRPGDGIDDEPGEHHVRQEMGAERDAPKAACGAKRERAGHGEAPPAGAADEEGEGHQEESSRRVARDEGAVLRALIRRCQRR